MPAKRRRKIVNMPEIVPMGAAVIPLEERSAVLSFQETPVAQEYLITFAEGGELEAMNFLEQATGSKSMVSTSSMSAQDISTSLQPTSGGGVVLSRLGMAALSLDPDQHKSLRRKSKDERLVVAVETAPYFTMAGPEITAEYLRAQRDYIDGLLARLEGKAPVVLPASPISPAANVSGGNTWGLEACNVPRSRFTGKGIRLAVLDTGLDLTHQDFASRTITHHSLIDGELVQTTSSHGTHCAGTAAGTNQPRTGPRYGIAWESDLFIGKVLANVDGGSRGRSVELGMEWALANRCDVISMSLGGAVLVGAAPFRAYERLGDRALRAGSLIIAAAGNRSLRRSGLINPVDSPADSSTIMAVAAVNETMGIADFSNGGINPQGGEVDIAGPGVEVYSSVPGSGYGFKDGTSMATPHVAGCAALWAQASGRRGRALWDLLVQNARQIALSRRDVGVGLVQAPLS